MKERILFYAKHGVFISVLPDMFMVEDFFQKGEEIKCCWRIKIDWKENDKWLEDDIGCHVDLDKMLESAYETADFILETKGKIK